MASIPLPAFRFVDANEEWAMPVPSLSHSVRYIAPINMITYLTRISIESPNLKYAVAASPLETKNSFLA